MHEVALLLQGEEEWGVPSAAAVVPHEESPRSTVGWRLSSPLKAVELLPLLLPPSKLSSQFQTWFPFLNDLILASTLLAIKEIEQEWKMCNVGSTETENIAP